MPGPNDSSGSTAHIGAKVPLTTKQRLAEIAHEETQPGVNKVTTSDLVRIAVRDFINNYEQDPAQFTPREEGQLQHLRNGGSP